MTRKRLLDHGTELLKLRLSIFSDQLQGYLPDWMDEIARYCSRRSYWSFLKHDGKQDVTAANPTFDWPFEPCRPDRINLVRATSMQRVIYRERSECELIYGPTDTGEPVYWCFQEKQGVDHTGQTYEVILYPPVPDQLYTLAWHGWFYLPRLTGDDESNRWTREYPLLILLGIVWWGKLHLEGFDAANVAFQHFIKMLDEEIEQDKERIVGDEDILRPKSNVIDTNVQRTLEWGLPSRAYDY